MERPHFPFSGPHKVFPFPNLLTVVLSMLRIPDPKATECFGFGSRHIWNLNILHLTHRSLAWWTATWQKLVIILLYVHETCCILCFPSCLICTQSLLPLCCFFCLEWPPTTFAEGRQKKPLHLKIPAPERSNCKPVSYILFLGKVLQWSISGCASPDVPG